MRKSMAERCGLVERDDVENYSTDYMNITKSKLGNTRGITLITLVVTVIVLLILARS